MESTTPLDLTTLWDQCLHSLPTTPASRQWLESSVPVGFSDDTVILAAPHSFAREWLDMKMGPALNEVLSQLLARPIQVMITVAPGAANLTPSEETEVVAELEATTTDPRTISNHHGDTNGTPYRDETPRTSADDTLGRTRPESDTARWPDSSSWSGDARMSRPAGPTIYIPPSDHDEPQLNPKYVFDHYIIGDSNRFAHAAAVAVAEAPAKSYNPLFVYGGSGLGKTHLLHAIGHYVRRLYPRLKVRYVTTEQFTNEFITGIQKRDGNAGFQRRYREVDLLMVDDIQFLERGERTQEEFFHTFNALHNAEKQIVISSDRAPRAIKTLEDRLRSRFEWGLLVDVQPPELETRIAILRRKAEAEHLDLPNEILELIAARVRSNIRELEGALHRVAAWASLSGSRPDLAVAEGVLKDVLPDDREREITCDLIMAHVAEFYSMSVDDLCSKSRSRQLVNARQIAMYLVRELTDMSFPQIGKAFGGRDHSTVMHAKDKIADLMKQRQITYDQVQELTAQVRASARGGT